MHVRNMKQLTILTANMSPYNHGKSLVVKLIFDAAVLQLQLC